jgi:hypothetical protein
MDEKGKKHLHQEVECQPNIWMRKQKKKAPTSRARIPNQYMDEKRMRISPWWNFRVSIGQNLCNIQYTLCLLHGRIEDGRGGCTNKWGVLKVYL